MSRRRIKSPNYTYTVSDNTVIAQSTFAGKPVFGIAKCDPRDEFDLEEGKKLAAARCNTKIAKKRRNRAHRQFIASLMEVRAAIERHNACIEYYQNALDALENAEDEETFIYLALMARE